MTSVLNIHWKDWSWSSNTLATWCEEFTHWKRLFLTFLFLTSLFLYPLKIYDNSCQQWGFGASLATDGGWDELVLFTFPVPSWRVWLKRSLATNPQHPTWCWERLKAGRKGDDRGWDGWMASLTWWAWVWTSCRSWWWTGKPGVQSMGLQIIGRDWVTEMNWTVLGTPTATSNEHWNFTVPTSF